MNCCDSCQRYRVTLPDPSELFIIGKFNLEVCLFQGFYVNICKIFEFLDISCQLQSEDGFHSSGK